MSDPFRVEGPACINFSGGRSSALMLRRVLDAHAGILPADVHVVFANTGKERPETLDFVAACAERWGVCIRWVERVGAEDVDDRWREVEYETASRNGEPFAELIDERKFLPNAVARFCTIDLKILVARCFMRAEGYDHWTSVVGLRRDEASRVAKVMARENREWDMACPLYDARIVKADVSAFWRVQSFDLALQSHEGNCDLCFLKGRATRERLMRGRPDLAAWWAEQERRVGGRFHAHEPGYAATLERVRRLPLLPMDLDPEVEAVAVACNCTDRRLPRVKRCVCNKRPGQGHTVACVLAQQEAA